MKPSLADLFAGALLGSAVGDSLGTWTERLTPSAVKPRFKGQLTGFPPLPHPYLTADGTFRYTADTQPTLCVTESLVDRGAVDRVDLARRFVAWSTSPDNVRAPSRTFMRAASMLRDGPDAGPMGLPSTCAAAATRFVPLGLLYFDQPAACAEAAATVAALTHADGCAQAAAAAVALLVAELLRAVPPDEALTNVAAAVAERSEAVAEALRGVAACAVLDEAAAFNCLGRGDSLSEVVPTAMYCLLRHPDDFAAAVLTAVNGGGKADTIAGLTGAFAGARLGLQALPADWLGVLENREGLTTLSTSLYELHERIRPDQEARA